MPVIVTAVLFLGVAFMTLFQQSIVKDLKTIDEIYQNAKLTFAVLPGTNSGGTLRFDITDAGKIQRMEEIESVYYYMSCHYTLREPVAIAGFSRIYGTNDIVTFAKEQELSITWQENYDQSTFLVVKEGEEVPCLMDTLLVEMMGMSVGDSIVIAPSEGDYADRENAPSVTLRIVGSYQDAKGVLEPLGLIITDQIFLGAPRLLDSAKMMQNYCHYQAFQMNIKPEYNREFETLQAAIKEIIGKDYILYTNIRTLKQAVRPLEQKVQLQQTLVMPLCALFALAAGVVVFLMARSFETEIFLRRLWGESKARVFGEMTASVAVHLLMSFGLAALGIYVICRFSWDIWALKYLLVDIGVCLVAAAVSIAMNCRKNLIITYQAREE